jgi:FkbM family methyltransferase
MPSNAAPLTKLEPCRHGSMLFLRSDKFIGASLDLYGEYCEAEAEVFAQIVSPGQVVVEAGANIGAHTVHLAKLVGEAGQVLAFEPQSTVFQILCANVALNDAFNVRTYHAAAGREAGTLKVPRLDYRRNNNYGGVSLLGVTDGEEVPVIALDTLDLPALRLLKIDVEGMEREVIAGARRQIARHRPVIYVENDRREQSPLLIAEIQDLGYELWWHVAFLWNPRNYRGVQENIFGGVASINVMCLPSEQPNTITGFRKITGPEDWWEDPPGFPFPA